MTLPVAGRRPESHAKTRDPDDTCGVDRETPQKELVAGVGVRGHLQRQNELIGTESRDVVCSAGEWSAGQIASVFGAIPVCNVTGGVTLDLSGRVGGASDLPR